MVSVPLLEVTPHLILETWFSSVKVIRVFPHLLPLCSKWYDLSPT